MSRAVLVLGVARSGTSMAAGITKRLGVDMGEADNPTHMNPGGAHENPTFLNITTSLQGVRLRGEDETMLKASAAEACKQFSKGRKLWGFKSAVTHHCLDVFLPHLTDPHLVVTWRNPFDVALSWVKLNESLYGNENMDIRWAVENMTKDMVQLAACLSHHHGLPVTSTTYEELKTHPLNFARRLAAALGVRVTGKMRSEIETFILPEYSTLG